MTKQWYAVRRKAFLVDPGSCTLDRSGVPVLVSARLERADGPLALMHISSNRFHLLLSPDLPLGSGDFIRRLTNHTTNGSYAALVRRLTD